MINSATGGIAAIKHFQTAKAKEQAKATKSNQKTAGEGNKGKSTSVDTLTGQKKVTMEQANQHSQQVVQQKAKQKRNFMEYLRKQDTSLGKVGDMDVGLQKKIAAQYTPSMRKKLMDEMDRASKGAKK